MVDYTDDLNNIRINGVKYVYILTYCIIVTFGLVFYNAHLLFVITFILGLIGFTISNEKLENKLAMERTKNHYVKSKLALKISEMEKSIENLNNSNNKLMLENLLEEIEIQNFQITKKVS